MLLTDVNVLVYAYRSDVADHARYKGWLEDMVTSESAFGMSKTRRPVNTATFQEIIINSGSTADLAKRATTTPIVIATRPEDTPAGAMAALILEVPNLDAAIASVKANGGMLMRPAAQIEGLSYAFVKDPDGNQIELIMTQK